VKQSSVTKERERELTPCSSLQSTKRHIVLWRVSRCRTSSVMQLKMSTVPNSCSGKSTSYLASRSHMPWLTTRYWVGFIDFCIGAISYILLTLLLPTRPFSFRATRLPTMIFASFGAMQIYSAYRGFCSQIWGRYSRQVKPWEMQDLESVQESLGDTSHNQAGRSESKIDLGHDSIYGPSGPRMSTAASDVISPFSMSSDQIFMPTLDRTIHADTGSAFDPTEIHLNDISGFGLSSPSDEPIVVGADSVRRSTMPASRSEKMVREGSNASSGIGDELKEAQIRRLNIRRETIKVPDAALAFPIGPDHDSYMPLSSPSSRAGSVPMQKRGESSSSSMSRLSPFSPFQSYTLGSPIMQNRSLSNVDPASPPGGKLAEISPFDERTTTDTSEMTSWQSGIVDLDSRRSTEQTLGVRMSESSPMSKLNNRPGGHPAVGGMGVGGGLDSEPSTATSNDVSGSPTNPLIASSSAQQYPDLSTLLDRFSLNGSRASHSESSHSPSRRNTWTNGRMKSIHVAAKGPTEAGTEAEAQGEGGTPTNGKTKVPIFGPESVVEDPVMKALFDSIIRDILIVGVFTGLVWVALCLAVPCAGLAS
jgi:hypothetical protein